MSKFLSQLITKDTPILTLESDKEISKNEKIAVLDLNTCITDIYIPYIYYKNGVWYYYKKEHDNFGYPFYIIDELIGSYLAKLRGLPTVVYDIAIVENKIGIASQNFKRKGYTYKILREIISTYEYYTRVENIEIIKELAVQLDNQKELLNQIFNLLALDMHMLQNDRGDLNFQFEINEQNRYISLAPLYDYSNCFSKVGHSGLDLTNSIVRINDSNILLMLKKYPEFKSCVEICLEHSMEKIWNQICLDYHFNQDCLSYERIRDYYQIKDEYQKRYIKQMLENTKK